MEVTGKVKLLYDTQTFDSGFSKREFVITTQEQYPQDIKFECIKDRIAILDGLQPGMDITVHFNLRGNEYQGKYFVNLQAWRIQPAEAASDSENFDQFQGAGDNAPLPTAEPALEQDQDDDLPF